ncbi:MAG: metal-dependent hydrolase [Candidatus Micrarchaeia archaeon]|jgi:membrane-bound metal-dependent hydrolase YbcI (DUF457 family)
MNSFAHIVFAFSCAFAANLALSFTGLSSAWTPQLLAVVVLGALLPDVDHRKTKTFKAALLVVFIAVVFLLNNYFGLAHGIAGGAIAALAFYLLKPQHRGITHKWPAALAFFALVFAATLDKSMAFCGLAAYASHLIADKL